MREGLKNTELWLPQRLLVSKHLYVNSPSHALQNNSIAPSAPPSSVSVSEVTSSSMTVQWGPVDCIQRNGDITGYSVQYKKVGSVSTHNRTVSGSNTSEAIIMNLMPSTMYIVQVAAINDAGDGVYSEPLTVSTNDSTMYAAATSTWIVPYIIVK